MSGWFPTGIYLNVPTGSADLWTTKDSTGRSEESKKLKWKEKIEMNKMKVLCATIRFRDLKDF